MNHQSRGEPGDATEILYVLLIIDYIGWGHYVGVTNPICLDNSSRNHVGEFEYSHCSYINQNQSQVSWVSRYSNRGFI
jgi:hypothetical protein